MFYDNTKLQWIIVIVYYLVNCTVHNVTLYAREMNHNKTQTHNNTIKIIYKETTRERNCLIKFNKWKKLLFWDSAVCALKSVISSVLSQNNKWLICLEFLLCESIGPDGSIRWCVCQQVCSFLMDWWPVHNVALPFIKCCGLDVWYCYILAFWYGCLLLVPFVLM